MTMRYAHLGPGGGANLISALESAAVATEGGLIGISVKILLLK